MTTLDELVRLNGRLTAVRVERWVARGLLRPSDDAAGWNFESVDVARVQLLDELVGDLGLDDEAVETVIDLVDQVHTLRRQLDLLGHALAEQPVATREAIAATLARLSRR